MVLEWYGLRLFIIVAVLEHACNIIGVFVVHNKKFQQGVYVCICDLSGFGGNFFCTDFADMGAVVCLATLRTVSVFV